jgi:hypothetical protein
MLKGMLHAFSCLLDVSSLINVIVEVAAIKY